MTEKWLIAPGEERVIDIESVTRLKVGLVGGQVDIIASPRRTSASKPATERSRSTTRSWAGTTSSRCSATSAPAVPVPR
jgi:hypothetical protein